MFGDGEWPVTCRQGRFLIFFPSLYSHAYDFIFWASRMLERWCNYHVSNTNRWLTRCLSWSPPIWIHFPFNHLPSSTYTFTIFHLIFTSGVRLKNTNIPHPSPPTPSDLSFRRKHSRGHWSDLWTVDTSENPTGHREKKTVGQGNFYYPWKLTWHWKIPMLNGKYIFKWWILLVFRGVGLHGVPNGEWWNVLKSRAW